MTISVIADRRTEAIVTDIHLHRGGGLGIAAAAPPDSAPVVFWTGDASPPITTTAADPRGHRTLHRRYPWPSQWHDVALAAAQIEFDDVTAEDDYRLRRPFLPDQHWLYPCHIINDLI